MAGLVVDTGVIGAGVGTRLRQVRGALARSDAFVSGPGQPHPPAGDGDGDGQEEAARALVLRALRSAADPLGALVMRRLAAGDASTADLAAAAGCPRVVAWEQVNDLVQAGLAARDAGRDRVGLTAAGHGLTAFVQALTEAAAAVPGAAAGGAP